MNRESGQVEPCSNATFAHVAKRIGQASRIAIFSHTKVDGDAVGSMLALTRALRNQQRDVTMFVMGPIEPSLQMVIGDTPYRQVETEPPTDDFDLAIVVDTSAWPQLEPVQEWLQRRYDRTIVLDHHAHGDSVGSMRIIDPGKASTTQLLIPLMEEIGCDFDGAPGGVAEPLFVGLATDTGWFRHNNAGADVFAVAARLLALGVDKSRLYQIIEETHRPARLALEARALSSLHYAADGAAAVLSLGIEDFRDANGSLEDLTGLVNMPMVVGRVRVSILLAQIERGVTKISFRSKPPLPGYAADQFIDVNRLAQQFGGGGHVHAAGARVNADLDEVRRRVIDALERLPSVVPPSDAEW